jgi:hypothetical protein
MIMITGKAERVFVHVAEGITGKAGSASFWMERELDC